MGVITVMVIAVICVVSGELLYQFFTESICLNRHIMLDQMYMPNFHTSFMLIPARIRLIFISEEK
ncbi:hypothetical protein D0O17_24305 [Salmonella enterica]|nr:hypothetical protein [Salmonella enterica]EBN7715222.1 hypothetical protein [Salmonella enterica]